MKLILRSLIVAALPFSAAFAQTAPQPIVAPVMQKDLTDLPGREMLMLSVEYPPGTVEHIHRHDAYAFVYVLEGSIVEGVRGAKRSRSRQDRLSTKALTMCTRSGATRARRSQQSSSWSW